MFKDSKDNSSSDEQFSKIDLGSDVIELFNVMLDNFLQSLNAHSPIVETPGALIVVRLMHPVNAPWSEEDDNVVMLFGRVIETILLSPENACDPTDDA